MTTGGRGFYRDSGPALRERLTEVERLISDLEGAFTTLFWTKAAADLDLSPPGAFGAVDKDLDHDDLLARVAQREARLDKLRMILDSIEALEDHWERPRQELPSLERRRRRARATSPASAVMLEEFERLMERAVPGAAVEAADEATRRVEFVSGDGTPFEVLCRTSSLPVGRRARASVSVRTTAPRLLGRVRIMPRSIARDLMATLRLSRSAQTGDPSFDDFFCVVGDAETISALLTPWVRMHLVDLAWKAVPTVIVGDSEARLERRWTPDVEGIRTALAVLRGIRARPKNMRLRARSARDDSR